MAATAATPARWNVRSRSSITSNVNARSRSSNTSSVNDRQRQEPQPQPKMMPRSLKQLTEQLRKQQEQLLQQQEKLRLQREHNSTVQMLSAWDPKYMATVCSAQAEADRGALEEAALKASWEAAKERKDRLEAARSAQDEANRKACWDAAKSRAYGPAGRHAQGPGRRWAQGPQWGCRGARGHARGLARRPGPSRTSGQLGSWGGSHG